jgi:hypothetical protein
VRGAVDAAQQVFVNEAGVRFAVHRRQVGVDHQIAADVADVELTQVLQHEEAHGRLDTNHLRVG